MRICTVCNTIADIVDVAYSAVSSVVCTVTIGSCRETMYCGNVSA